MRDDTHKANVILTDGTVFTNATPVEAPTDPHNAPARYYSDKPPLTFKVDVNEAYEYNSATVEHALYMLRQNEGLDEDGNPIDDNAAVHLKEKYGKESPSTTHLLNKSNAQITITFMEHTIESITWL